MSGLIQKLFPDSVIISHEVHDALDKATIDLARVGRLRDKDLKLQHDCMDAYFHLQRDFPLEEDYESSDEWVIGKVQADISEIKQSISKGAESPDFDQIWQILLETRAIAVVGDTVTLPLLMRKQDLLDEARHFLERTEQR